MSKKVIALELSDEGIDKAIKELENYKQDVVRKTNLLRQKVAERIAEEAQQGFNGAIVDDRMRQKQSVPVQANVTVSTEDNGSTTVVIADGEDAVWVEFGAGVYYNGSAGSSPNPYGVELGLTIGSYGKNGKRKTWGFYEDGELYLTHGTPARMPMARAVASVCNDISDIAREVFG